MRKSIFLPAALLCLGFSLLRGSENARQDAYASVLLAGGCGVADTSTASSAAAIQIGRISLTSKTVFVAVGREQLPGGREQSVVLRSSNGGSTWERLTVDSNRWLYDIFFVDGETGWICGYDGLILKTTDAGANWKKQNTSVRSAFVRIQFIDKDLGWAVAEDGHVLRTTDGGARWAATRVLPRGSLRTLDFRTGTYGWAVGEHGGAYRSTDGGVLWESLGGKMLSPFRRLGKPALGFRAVKFFSDRNGLIAANVSDRSGDRGILLKTQDGGGSWSIIEVSSDRVGLIDACFLSSTSIWVVPQFSQRLFHTLDGGRSWVPVRPVTDGGTPLGVYFLDPTVGVVVVSYGLFSDEVLYTTDGGTTWTSGELPRNE